MPARTRPARSAREATAELLLAGAQERAGEQRPGDGATAVLDDDDVVPAVEQLTQRARRVAVLDDLAVVLPDQRDGHDHPPAGLDDSPELPDAVRRIGDVVERLDARDAVVAVVGARQELRRDDVGHAVAVVDVEPDDAHAGRDEVVVRAAAAEHVEDDAARLGEPAPARAAGRRAAGADAGSRTATAADAGACDGRRRRGPLRRSSLDPGDGPGQLRPDRRTDPVVGLPRSRSDAEAQRLLDHVVVVARVDVDADEVVVRPAARPGA